ncbi:gtpase binding protein rid1 [Diplodia corticola]|uniref:Gtpase binding protein rid1 n=1 Tax=Diplodia corticola TaxID=236234 RepID=A0A1J9RIN0_9PEZI|nr:gtpase binding protein rid1 [Diplodia corticola]OJD40504.1 gtpase binding protein rid1 [Diplodia corticola]
MSAIGSQRLATAPDRPSHRRNRSATTIKSILTGLNHKRSPSDGTALAVPDPKDARRPRSSQAAMASMPVLPPDHPHAQRVLGEIHNQPGGPASPRKSKDGRDGRMRGLHKKTLSTVSLRSLAKEREKSKDGAKDEQKDYLRPRSEDKMKKPKSSTSLSAVFSKAKSQKKGNANASRDKENTTPPHSATEPSHTPIWAEFSSQRPSEDYHEITTTTTIPLAVQRDIEHEIALYTPADYTPTKQRNFYDVDKPTLQQRHPSGGSTRSKSRPNSWYLPKSASAHSFVETLSRKSEEKKQTLGGKAQTFVDNWKARGESRRPSAEESTLRRTNSQKHKGEDEKRQVESALASKRGSKVMAAVAAINGRSTQPEPETPLDQEQIDAEFEAVLDSRNIPENLRSKMRSLNTRVKADFISKNKIEEPKSAVEPVQRTSIWGKPTVGRRTTSDQSSDRILPDSDDPAKSPRPRSKTFTFSRGDKGEKQKSEVPPPDRSSKSYDAQKSPSSKSLSSATGSSFFSRAPKAATPEEFVAYLRKVQKPELVEVGKLHKLRLLLRNETVAWVDAFICQGGMMEIVGLLERIMQIEWREEHEDTLLHESLLCLKGLCTTKIACQKLCEIESTLFPALLAMLFDEEHKGPSEFTTRGLIMSLLFAHLCSALETPEELPGRARTILKYLQGPQKPEEARPVPFILEMHQPRPYRIWCQEIVNVTKEVFWIFLHHLNVIPFGSDSLENDGNKPAMDGQKFAQHHFPQPRPPVPAAPYVGGVEWDATNYISTHLDLMNGILASLPTVEERNDLRYDLRASGFEKVMGGQLRTCKEKFYGAVHDGLKTWVKAAVADGWEVKDVRMGLREDKIMSPKKAGPRKKVEAPPKIETPKVEIPGLDFGSELEKGLSHERKENAGDFWL